MGETPMPLKKTMSCEQAAQVHAYHDGALASPQRAAVEAHLEGCADCRDLLADLRGLSSLIAAAPLAAISPAAMARLNDALRTARDRGLLRITTWLTAAAAAILIGALLMFPHTNGPSNPVVASAPNVDPAWEPLAVMPPLEADESVPEVVALAQWMANDLSYGERQ
jgi:anti-sigma factor RsiW